MRITSAIFVSSLTRRLFSDGLMAAVEKKGSPEAGAIFIRVVKRDRTQMLLCPAPQSYFEEKSTFHVFEVRLENAYEMEVNEKLEREKSFDSDIWIVEIETDTPEAYLDIRYEDES
ncbi:MAG: DUF1491 family protein [Lentilitoribacter sp.]